MRQRRVRACRRADRPQGRVCVDRRSHFRRERLVPRCLVVETIHHRVDLNMRHHNNFTSHLYSSAASRNVSVTCRKCLLNLFGITLLFLLQFALAKLFRCSIPTSGDRARASVLQARARSGVAQVSNFLFRQVFSSAGRNRKASIL